jgi:copper chaperone CopZ
MRSDVVGRDQLVLIRIEGMHCHKCEHAIRQALCAYEGVHEVEVDFPSSLASVLYQNGSVTIDQLVEAIREAGYHVTEFAQRQFAPRMDSHLGQ